MVNIVWVLMATTVAIFLEKDNLKHKWSIKETIVFFVSLFIGTSLCIAWVLRVDLLNPLDIIADIYRPITDPLSSYIRQFK